MCTDSPRPDLVTAAGVSGAPWPLRQARGGGAGRGEAGHLLRGVVLDVLQAEQAVGDHAVSPHAHVQVALRRILAEADGVVGEVAGRGHGGDVRQR